MLQPLFLIASCCPLLVRHPLHPLDEERFLSAVLHYTNSSTVHFKLSPAYVLYAAGRSALRTHGGTRIINKGVAMAESVIQASINLRGRLIKAIPTGCLFVFFCFLLRLIVRFVVDLVQRQRSIAGALAFWMANSSELLNFLKHDRELNPLTQQSQLDLSNLVHKAYK